VTTIDVGPTDRLTVDAARRFAGQFTAAWNSHDPERLVALSDREVQWEDPDIAGGRLVGHVALRIWLRAVWRALPDLRFEADGPLHLAEDGGSLMGAWIALGTMTGPRVPPGLAPTGQPIVMRGIDTYWIREGRAVRVRTVTDMLALARQTGALPPEGSRGERVAVLLQRLTAARRRRATRAG
jgi:predicted ester cyclase